MIAIEDIEQYWNIHYEIERICKEEVSPYLVDTMICLGAKELLKHMHDDLDDEETKQAIIRLATERADALRAIAEEHIVD